MRSAAAWLLAAWLPASRANVYVYDQALLSVDEVDYRKVGMWAPSDLPRNHHSSSGAGGSGSTVADSSVSIDLTFHRSDARRPGLVQVTLFNAEQMPRVGATLPAARAVCRRGGRGGT